MRGLIDGALSTLGVVIGAFSSPSALLIISAAFSGAIANGFSNILAAFSAERTEGYKKIQEIEDAMITKLKGSAQEKHMRRKVMKNGIIDGISTIIGGIIPILPILFFTGISALYASIAVVTVLMGVLGVYSGFYAKENLVLAGAKMVIFALITAGVCIGVEMLL